ncbi:MAG: EAL domain-containing protein [Alphaproteobacteria bacterium]|nr:EAL domain-containing protein [Alphaproteobacteria bacterium]
MVNVVLVVLYVLAGAAASLGLAVFGPAEPALCAMVGVVVFLALMQAHSGVRRGLDRRDTRRQFAMLKQATQETAVALQDANARIEAVKAATAARADAQSKKIVSELKVLESLMRDFATRISEKAKEVPADQEFIERRAKDSARSYLDTLGESDLLETIRASLEENRVDLYLQPIVSLPQRKLRYYEALSRLRAEDGSVIMPAQYMKVAAPAGLMSVVDNLLLFRCVQIVRRLTQKQSGVGVFCNISGDTLCDEEFFPQFLEYMHHNRDLAQHIVFEFAQGALTKAGEKGEENLRYLASLGFALSMDHVETLAVDFAALKAMGFKHLKVRAETLINGMGNAQAAVAAEDFKKLLSRHGLNLIAERVEDEKEVVQLLDYSVDFGQGYLFGEPRAVREDSLRAVEKAAPTQIIPFRKTA